MKENKDFSSGIESALKTIGEVAADALENITSAITGAPENLRDGTEFAPVELPRDLYAHGGAQTEWWYYTGHFDGADGDRYGFELVFFKRRTDLDKFGPVPLRLLGNPIYFAHFALTDKKHGQFRYSHRKSANGWLDDKAHASESHYHLRLGDWSVREAHGCHLLRAALGDDCIFEASLRPTKDVVLNGSKRDGVSYKDEDEASRYFSITRMDLDGVLQTASGAERIHGQAWMDREFGTWAPTERQKGWDWFSIQLDDESEIMVYQLRDSKGDVSPYSSGLLVAVDGSSEHLDADKFKIETLEKWESPNSGAEYPSRWTISIPEKEIKLEVTPILNDQELDTRGTTMIVYWEGACEVRGTAGGKEVEGDAYVELVGYDRSHENPNLAYFLVGNRFEA
ncbi:MAG: lipocalin family protein [Pyrinomonadaceae bacterium]